MLTHLLRASPPAIPLESTPKRSPSESHRTVAARLHLESFNLAAASESPMGENSALLQSKGDHRTYGVSETHLHPPDDDDHDGHELLHERDIEWQGYPTLLPKQAWFQDSQQRIRSCFKSCDRRMIWENGVLDAAYRVPAVTLGLLLNILDALSYGMILFPLGQPVFEKLGPDGISIFYVSCIISQLVYSLGGSVFKGGIGSEMV